MTRRPTYGERMSDWEREQDQRDEQHWQSQLHEALMLRDIEKVHMLVSIGYTNAYSFESFRNEPLVKFSLRKIT